MSKALKSAIEANDPDAVRKALKGVKDVNRKLPGTKSPLLFACSTGADRVLEVLFEAGAIAEKRNTFPGDTPFAAATAHRQLGVMKRLLDLKQVSKDAVEHVLQTACMDGKADVLEFALQHVKPKITIELFRLAALRKNAPTLLKLLLQHGGDLNARHDRPEANWMTPLHDLVDSGKPDVIRTLVECGANINARDGLGRTPLMILAQSLESLEFSNARAGILQKSLASGEATLISGEAPSAVSCSQAVQTLLALGADASLVDNSGNDAIDHYTFEYLRSDGDGSPEIISILHKAGAKGSESTLALFRALKRKDVKAVRDAIKHGADVNRLTPAPVTSTPLSWAVGDNPESLQLVNVLLESGADPNKSDRSSTPLIQAARSGNLEVVKALLAAGADLHTVYQSGEYIENAYSAAERNEEVRNYLKSLGAKNPVRAAEPLTPGVKSWNDFSELLVKGTVEEIAGRLARMIKGTVQQNVYGQSLRCGKQAYVVLRPKNMNWCNIYQIAPAPVRFEDAKKAEASASAVAKACDAPVLLVEYSDTSDAASILRIEPTGRVSRDKGWDRESLQEMVDALDGEAPAWAKKQLAKTGDDEPRSTERLQMLADQERFVVAAFGLSSGIGRNVDVEFTGYGEDTFDGVALVTN